MGFEDNFLTGVARRMREEKNQKFQALKSGVELPPIVDLAHRQLTSKVFSDRAYSTQAPDFFEVYGKEEVTNDMREVLALRTKFVERETPEQKKMKKLSETFEGLILVNAKKHKWLGELDVYKTSLYDDFKNKTDLYGQWHTSEGTKELALAVDLTFSYAKGASKLDDIKRSIEAGVMGQLKYFKGAKKPRTNVPRIVLGVGTREISDLASLWVTHKEEKLANHPVRFVLVSEMYAQLSGMESYARQIGQSHIAQAYEEALSVVEPLYKEVGDRLASVFDPVDDTIKQKMRSFKA